VVTGKRPDKPQPDDWIGGEIIRYDVASTRAVAASAHSVRSAAGIVALASPTLTHAIVLTKEGSLHCVEAASGRPVWEVGMQTSAMCASFSLDGKRCLIGLDDGEVLMVGEKADEILWRRRAHEFQVEHAALSVDARHAVTLGIDRSIVCWDAATGKPVAGAPARYDRTRDPLGLIANPGVAADQLRAKLGPAVAQVIAGTQSFAMLYGSHIYRFPYTDLSKAERIGQGPSATAPDGRNYIVYETIQDEKKKSSKLGCSRSTRKRASESQSRRLMSRRRSRHSTFY